MKSLIEIKNLTKTYQEAGRKLEILNKISLRVKKGDFLTIMGPSGSGKTTFLNILGCLDRPTSGSYKLEDEEVSRKSEKDLARIRNQKIGFIFQTFNLLPRASVMANLILPTLYSKNRKPNKEELFELLNKVNLKERVYHKPNQLSGGEQQRVAIARALVNKPEIILADEPTGNLDKKSEEEIMKLLKKLNKEGVTLLLVTHDSEIARQAKRIIKLEHGLLAGEKCSTGSLNN